MIGFISISQVSLRQVKVAETEQETQIQENAVKEPSATYARNTEIPTFFGKPMLRGEFFDVDPETADPDTPSLFYAHPNGEIWVGDAIAWLRSLESESVDLVFADPPSVSYTHLTLPTKRIV